MKLTKRCKNVLDFINRIEPNNNEIYYTVEYSIDKLDLNMTYADLVGVLQTLESAGTIRWGDSQHSAFALNESGKEYKQINRLEAKERWCNRIVSFVLGVLSALVISWLVA